MLDLRSVDTPIVVRDATGDDLAALTDIYNHYVLTSPATFDTRPFSVEERRDTWFIHYNTEGPHRLLVAAVGPRILGYATSSQFRPKPAYVTTVATSVYCSPSETGKGVGSLLYRRLFDCLDGLDLHRPWRASRCQTRRRSRCTTILGLPTSVWRARSATSLEPIGTSCFFSAP